MCAPTTIKKYRLKKNKLKDTRGKIRKVDLWPLHACCPQKYFRLGGVAIAAKAEVFRLSDVGSVLLLWCEQQLRSLWKGGELTEGGY